MRIKSLIGALVAGLFSTAVLAQSTPGFTPGQVPSAAQWNAAFGSKLDTSSVGGVGASMLAAGAAASNIGLNILWGAQSGTRGTYGANTITLQPNGPWFGSQMSIYGGPYGWGNSATVFCVQSYQGSNTPCGVNGNMSVNVNNWATYTARDAVTQFNYTQAPVHLLTNGNPPPVIIAAVPGTFTKTTFTPTTPLTGGQVALLQAHQQLKSSDGCTGDLNNWQTNGTVLYLSGWSCGGSYANPPVGTSAEVDQDPARQQGTWTSSTKFTLALPLNSTQLSKIKVGMPVDSDSNPVCSGTLTDWDTVNGTYINMADGMFVQGSGAACTPTGSSVLIGDITKMFGENIVVEIDQQHRPYEFTGSEYDCNNHSIAWITSSTPLGRGNAASYCLDLVSTGIHEVQYGLALRGGALQVPYGEYAFYDGIHVQSSIQNAAVNVQPAAGNGINIAFSSNAAQSGGATIADAFRDWKNGGSNDIWAQLGALTGVWKLGDQSSTSSSPGLKLFSSGANTGNPDSSIVATGGSGTEGTGFITLKGHTYARANTDGTAIFVVQNAAATASILAVDTLNNLVNTGGNTNGLTFKSAATGTAPSIIPNCGDSTCNLLLQSYSSGGIVVRPQADSTFGFRIQKSDTSATPIAVDTLNNVVNIGADFYTSGTTPTIGTCGTSPAISGTDVSGKITIGSGTVTACTISFHATLPNAPHGVVITPANSTAAAQGTTLAYVSSISTASWVVTGAALAGAQYYYHVE